jgi:hypothetical protein
MNGQHFAGALTLAVLTLIAQTGEAQEEIFPKTPYPMGQVIDDAGQPVAGARIRIRVEHSGRYRRAVHHLLQVQPLVPSVSGRDGSYVLPLTQGQRHLTVDEAIVSLVVDKDGYLPWVENLPAGLHGYLGSRAILRRPAVEDRLAFTVEDSVPSMLLTVRRVVMGGKPYSASASIVATVPRHGRVETLLSLIPNPPQFSSSNRSLPLRLEARVLYPARSTPARDVFSRSENRFSRPVSEPGGEARVVRLHGGGTLTGLRGLYRCPDRRLRWFDLPGEVAPEDTALQLVGLVADGHRATTAIEEPVLRALPVSAGPRRIVVRDHDRARVPGVRAQLLAMEYWTETPGDPVPTPIGVRPILRLRGDADGILILPPELPDEPSYLLVEAPGHLPMRIVDPRGLDPRSELRLEKVHGGGLALQVVGAADEPVPFASLVFGDDAYTMGALLGALPRTDREGRLLLDHLPSSDHVVGVIADGFEPKWQAFTVSAGGEVELKIGLTPTVDWHVVTVDAKNRPVPFAALQRVTSTQNGRARSYQRVTTDSLGRAVLQQHGDGLSIRSPRRGPSVLFTDPARIHRTEVQPMPVVMIALGPGTSILQENWRVGGRISSRFTTPRREGFSRVLMRWVGERAAGCSLIVDRGAPVRLEGTEVMAAWAADPGKIVMVDRSRTTRRVPITVIGNGAPLREELEVIYHRRGSTINLALGRGQLLENGPAGLCLALRDDWELPCTLLHPDYEPLEFTVPERSGPEKPLELRLRKGTRLGFDVTFDKLPSQKTHITLRVRRRTAGTYVLNTIDKAPELAPEDLGKPIRIQSPGALPEGEFRIYLRIPGLPTLSADVVVEAGKPIVFDVKANKKP